MRISIRIKLLFYMVVTILIFTVVLLGFNLIFTRGLYMDYKKGILLETVSEIDALLSDNNGESTPEFELNRLERRAGASMFIQTPDGELYYPTRVRPPERNPFLPFGPADAANDMRPGEQNEDYPFTIRNDPQMEFNTLRIQQMLSNGMEILIWLPMDEISDSISVFNRIVVLASLIVLVCSVFWSLYISKKFTKPITRINLAAKKISAQDFTQTLEIKGRDEIGELSESINELSAKLNDAITKLSEKNIQLEKDIIYEKSLDKMRKMFVSNVSHELKTPMFLIQGYAEGLKQIGHRPDKREFYCNVIINETDKMDKLIKDLLDLAQIESGVFAVKPRSFDIVKLARDTLEVFEPLFEQKGINVTVSFPEARTVNADPLRIEQVLTNFLNNAIDHVDDKNKISVTITDEPGNGKVRVAVFNSGENIPLDVVDKIWVAFYKADESRAREYGGTGLGLSITRAIQESHGGGYGVNNLDGGVEFWITL